MTLTRPNIWQVTGLGSSLVKLYKTIYQFPELDICQAYKDWRPISISNKSCLSRWLSIWGTWLYKYQRWCHDSSNKEAEREIAESQIYQNSNKPLKTKKWWRQVPCKQMYDFLMGGLDNRKGLGDDLSHLFLSDKCLVWEWLIDSLMVWLM